MHINHFSIARRRCDKKLDSTNRKDKNYFVITVDDIAKYVDYELGNSYFSIGDTVYNQKNGLPMGGLISACLADITSIYKEYKNKVKNNTRNTIKRFRDDILVITNNSNKKERNDLIKKLKGTYGPTLSLELEEESKEEVTFLDYIVFNDEGILKHRHKGNKFREEEGRVSKVRFPEYFKGCEKYNFTQILRNQFKQSEFRSSTTKEIIGAATNLAIELKIRGFPNNVIKKAIYMAKIKGEHNILENFREAQRLAWLATKSQPNFRNILSENLFLRSRGPKSPKT